MKAVLVNYDYDPRWLKNYPELDVTLYDRTDTGVDHDLTQYGAVYHTKNLGDVDYDKLGYLIENYDKLPDVFLWGKSNLTPRFVTESDLQKALQANVFQPLLKYDHAIYSDKFGPVNMYRGEMYWERADSWFFNATTPKYFHTWEDWCLRFGLPREAYIPFAPGGNYILTKERVHRYSRDFYEEMRSYLPHAQRPAEAQACERSYYLLWR